MIETTKNTHGGKRAGAGRKPAPWPTQLIKIKASADEMTQVLKLSTRERAEILLKAAKSKA